MLNKKSMIFALILLSLLTFSAVNASELTNETSNLTAIENEDLLAAESNDLLSENSEGSFSDLANEIEGATGELNLTRNYSYVSGDSKYGIGIYKSIVINGNGFTINGNNKATVFRITGGVVLNDLKFVNCRSNEDGGAVYWGSEYEYDWEYGSNGVMSGCSFVNCYAGGGGSAVYWNGANGTLSDCSFVNCSSKGNSYGYNSGGAVCWNGADGTLSDCSFVNCYVESMGSAVSWNGANGILSDCSFVNSSSKYAGIVCWDGADGILSDCSFVNCSSKYAGAVEWRGDDGILSDCSFVNCYSDDNAGAVEWRGVDGVLYNCSFVNCHSIDDEGGAIFWFADNSTLFNCSFVNCSAADDGGAVCWLTNYGHLFDCSFVNCSNKFWGGAVDIGGHNNYLYDCSFVNCSCDIDGGAVAMFSTNGAISGCSFVNCYSGRDGGAIYWPSYDGVLSGCSFVNCSSMENGGAISWKSNNGIVEKSSFINCSAEDCGGGIYFKANNCRLSDSIFEGNAAKNGFDVYAAENIYAVNVTADKFSSVIIAPDMTMGYHGHKDLIITLRDINNNGFVARELLTVIFNNHIYNKITDSNGQLSFDLPDDLDLGNYTAEISFYGTGSYYPSSTSATVFVNKMDTRILAVHNVEDMEMVATLTTEEGTPLPDENLLISFNGRSYSKKTDFNGQVKLSTANLTDGRYTANISYEGNSKYNLSDRLINVYVNESEDTVKTLIDLSNEIANADGQLNLTGNYSYDSDCDYNNGIIIDKTVVINGNGFTLNGNNQARIFKITASDVVLNNICFVNCSFNNYGGAVYWNGFNGTLSNCSFVNCSANDGGAVFVDADNSCLLDCSFVNCSSDSEGGAVFWNYDNVNNYLSSCSFVNCSCYYGGAVYWGSYDGVLSDCTFVNCSSVCYGGAVYWTGADGILDNCSFVNCSVDCKYTYYNDVGGGAVYWIGDRGVVSESSFVNCSSKAKNTSYGGGIYFRGEGCTLISPTFEGNNATMGPDWYSVEPLNFTNQIKTVLSIPDVITIYGASKNVIATLKDINGNIVSGVKVKIVVGSLSKIARTDENGEVSLDISGLEPGEYKISARSGVTDSYSEAKTTAKAIIYAEKFNTTLIIPDVLVIGNPTGASVIATLTDSNGNVLSDVKVKIVVGSLSKIARTDANGQVSLDISSLDIGEYKISARSGVTDIYNEAKATAKATIMNKIDPILEIPDVVVQYGDAGAVVATLKDADGNVVSGVKVKIVVGSLSKIARTDVNGQVSLDISGLEPGEYNVAARSGVTDIYNEAKATAKATIMNKINPILEIPDVVVQYGDAGAVVATLKDADGNVVSGVKVKIVVGSLSKIARTDVNGQVSLDISGLEPGEYNVAARSGVTDIYNEAKATAKATIIDKINPILEIPDVVVQYGDAGAVVATLKDESGNIIAGVKVKIVVGNLSKIARTDANGQISLDISGLAPGEYKISARSGVTDLYNEAKTTATATVVNKIDTTLTIPNVTVKQGTSGAKAVATLKDANGNVVSGVKVKIVVGDLSKIARTDANGQVSIDISSLAAGEYKIAARSAVTDFYNEAKGSAKAIITAN